METQFSGQNVVKLKEELEESEEDVSALLSEEGIVAEECQELQVALSQAQAADSDELRQEFTQAMEDLDEARFENGNGHILQQLAEQKSELLQNEEDIEALLHEEGVFAEECEELQMELSDAREQNLGRDHAETIQECEELRSELMDVLNDPSEAEFKSGSTRKLQEELEQQRGELEGNAEDIELLLSEENAFAQECEELRVELTEAQEGISPAGSERLRHELA